MAIQNASDLLIYKKSSGSNVAQVTQFFIKSDGNTPLDATGNVKVTNLVNAAGSSVSDETVTVGTNTDLGLATALRDAIHALAGYTCTGVSSNDDGRVFTATNAFQGDLADAISVVDGTSEIEAGAIDITVTTPGSSANAYEPIAFSTSASISFTRDLRDITTKDSDAWSEQAPGMKSFEMSTDALQDYTSDLNFQQFIDDLGTGNNITLRFKQRTTGGDDQFYQGDAIVSSVSVDSGVEDNLTYSVTFTGTASVTTGTD